MIRDSCFMCHFTIPGYLSNNLKENRWLNEIHFSFFLEKSSEFQNQARQQNMPKILLVMKKNRLSSGIEIVFFFPCIFYLALILKFNI